MATTKKIVKKAQFGESIGDKLAAKTAERNTKGAPLREGQVKRMTRVFEANPERGIKVAKRMQKRANTKAGIPAMKTGGKVAKSPAQKKFAALAAPKDKITFADKIAGAKKKK